MQSAKFLGNFVDVGDDSVGRKMFPQVTTNMLGQLPMLSAEQKRRIETLSAKTMDCDDRVHVFDESFQVMRRIGGDFDRRDMALHAFGLMYSVVTGSASFGGLHRNDFGHFLEAATVIGHETDSLIRGKIQTTKGDDFFDIRMIQ